MAARVTKQDEISNDDDDARSTDDGERARRLAGFAPALPLVDVAGMLNLPTSTLDALIAAGKGPKVFRLGRRRYSRWCDIVAWLDRAAEAAR